MSGTIKYNSGSQNLPTDACGMFTAKIGELNQSQFSQIDWTSGTKFLEVKADGLPIGNQQMVSVPYALYAERSGDIAIFEERRPHNLFPGNTILIWNTRQLNTTVLESTSNMVELTNNSLKFNKPGKYLITASAPGYYTGRHRLVLKSNNPDQVKIFGTSELSTNTLSPQTRSHIMGILEVTAVGATYRLDHYVNSGTGNGQQLGVETNLPQPNNTSQDYETYAQIMVQKIQ